MFIKNKYMIIDGYNVINAVEKLRAYVDTDLDKARTMLVDWMNEYAAFKKTDVCIVFDAYATKSIKPVEEVIGHVTVVFTRKGQTADSYIEKMATELSNSIVNEVKVVTKDWAQQQIVHGKGAIRITPRELFYELDHMGKKIKSKYGQSQDSKNKLESALDEKVLKTLEKLRLKKE